MVTTEQRPSLIGAKRRLDVLKSLEIDGTAAVGIINRAHPDSGVSPAAVEQAIGLPIIARIRTRGGHRRAGQAGTATGALSERRCHTRLHTNLETYEILNAPEGRGGETARGPS